MKPVLYHGLLRFLLLQKGIERLHFKCRAYNFTHLHNVMSKVSGKNCNITAWQQHPKTQKLTLAILLSHKLNQILWNMRMDKGGVSRWTCRDRVLGYKIYVRIIKAVATVTDNLESLILFNGLNHPTKNSAFIGKSFSGFNEARSRNSPLTSFKCRAKNGRSISVLRHMLPRRLKGNIYS